MQELSKNINYNFLIVFRKEIIALDRLISAL